MTDAERPEALYQKREKIQNRRVSGPFQRLRVATIWLTLSWYFFAPWLLWHGRQAILFDIANRKFYIFGITFWPQDFFLLSWSLIFAAFGLIFITTLAGRLWCGYTCPQTVWTRFFMWIEYMTEGDRNHRLKLDKNPWSLNTIARRLAKHTLWLSLALGTAITFVGFFVPIRELIPQLIQYQIIGWPLFWICFFTIATYLNAGWMREQVCIYMCPYARFQSVMLDQDTMIISYDEERGEPRGSRSRAADHKAKGLGDCVNCTLCVQVCPTGIDIRKGLQYECIGCAACIDACDQVMTKLDYPKGLIRYTTEHRLQKKKSPILRSRVIVNGLLLIIMASVLSYTLLTRVPLQLDVLRARSQLYRETTSGMIQNVYTLKIMNMSQRDQQYTITVKGFAGLTYHGPKQVKVHPGEILDLPVNLQASPEAVPETLNVIHFSIDEVSDPKIKVTTDSRFIGPAKE